MGTVRDYVSGGALLPIDLFPPRDIDSNEIYQLLYSVACCEKCTKDVVALLRGSVTSTSISSLTTTSPMGLSAEQVLHLIYRSRFLGIEENVDIYHSLYYQEKMPEFILVMMRDTKAYSDLKCKISHRSYADSNIERNIMEGIRLRVTDGRGVRDLLDPYLRCGSAMLDEEELIAVIMFGTRSILKKVRRGHSKHYYYCQIWSLVAYASFLTYMPSWRVLGLEELVTLSVSAYMNETIYEILRQMKRREEDMWALPRVLLRGNTSVIEDNHWWQSTTLEYGGGGEGRGLKMYTVSLRSEGGKVQYVCGNGVTYSYYMLLLIIVHRFIFTYDREYLIESLLRLVEVEEVSLDYLNTYTTRPAIHDLIVPPDIFHSRDREVRVDPNEVFQGRQGFVEG